MALRDLVFVIASLMVLGSGATLFARRFASSAASVTLLLENSKFLLPMAMLLLAAERISKADHLGAVGLALCATGLAVAQVLWHRNRHR